MNSRKIYALSLTYLMLCSSTVYANTTNNLKVSFGTSVSQSQTLKDTDGDGYFAVKFPSATGLRKFSLTNYGEVRVDVIVYEATSGNTVWSARVNPGKSQTSASTLSLPAGKYYFEVVSDDGSALNVICTAKY